MRGVRVGVVGAAALAFTACATIVRPEVHEAGWLELETAHVRLRTDLGRDEAIERAIELEQVWAALAHLYRVIAPAGSPPQQRLEVVNFEECNDFDVIRVGRTVAGFVFTARNPGGGRIAVTCEQRSGRRRIVIHELAHVFNHNLFTHSPAWLNEGLATYYSTFRVQDGRAVLGHLPPELERYWRKPAFLPEVDELLGYSYAEFHAGKDNKNYYAAWKLIHLLNNSDEALHRRFQRYLAELAGGADKDEAWDSVFGDVPEGLLAKAYEAYRLREGARLWVTPYERTNPPPPRVRELSPGEAHALWAHLLSLDHEDAVGPQLDRAAEAAPDWPAVLYWRAVLQPEREDDVELLRAYLERRPEDPRGWEALVGAQLDDVIPSDYLGLEGVPPEGLAAMEADVRELVRRASHASALNLIGWYYAMLQKPTMGLNFGIRAVNEDPGCAGCWDTVALLYFQTGKLEEAVTAQERAANLYDEGIPDSVLARLRRYRAAAKTAR